MIINKKHYLFIALLLSTLAVFNVYSQEIQSIPFVVINQSPYSDDCEDFIDMPEELKKCFIDFVNQFVVKNFDTSKFNDLDEGLYKVVIQFKIDTQGKVVDVKSRGPFPEMEKEAVSVISKMPILNPGMHEGKVVKTIYSLPIQFKISEKVKK